MKKICIVGASGKLGLYMVKHALDRGYQVEACRRVFASDTRWTVVRGSDLEEGESQGLPVFKPPCGRRHPRSPGDCRLPNALGDRSRIDGYSEEKWAIITGR